MPRARGTVVGAVRVAEARAAHRGQQRPAQQRDGETTGRQGRKREEKRKGRRSAPVSRGGPVRAAAGGSRAPRRTPPALAQQGVGSRVCARGGVLGGRACRRSVCGGCPCAALCNDAGWHLVVCTRCQTRGADVVRQNAWGGSPSVSPIVTSSSGFVLRIKGWCCRPHGLS